MSDIIDGLVAGSKLLIDSRVLEVVSVDPTTNVCVAQSEAGKFTYLDAREVIYLGSGFYTLAGRIEKAVGPATVVLEPAVGIAAAE